MKHFDFIEQMVHDTIDSDESSSMYYLKFNDRPEFTVNLESDDSRRCLSVQIGTKRIEFPKNWGPFKNRVTSEIILTFEDDPYQLLDIINMALNKNFKSIKFVIPTNRNLFTYKQAA